MEPNLPSTDLDLLDDESSRTERVEQVLAFHAVPPTARVSVASINEDLTIKASAQLSGLFFVAEDPHNDSQRKQLHQNIELTCYRRNMFSVRGLVSIHRLKRDKHGAKRASDELCLSKMSRVFAKLSAVETLHNKPITILSHPKVHQEGTEEPKPLSFDIQKELDAKKDVVSFHINWDRLKFRAATSKNTRQNTTPQHYQLVIELVTLDNGGKTVVLYRSLSARIVVRGRSPGNFANPGGGLATIKRRPSEGRSEKPTASDFNSWLDIPDVDFGSPINRQLSADELIPSIPLDFGVDAVDPWLSFLDHNQPLDSLSSLDESMPFSGVLDGSMSSNITASVRGDSDISRLTVVPTSTSLEQDFTTQGDDDRDERPAKKSAANVAESSRSGVQEEESLSYEPRYQYFPLSVDDWTIPAQAVYRPHGGHNYGLAHVRLRKRYFLENTSDL